jgi:hypothetical protein
LLRIAPISIWRISGGSSELGRRLLTLYHRNGNIYRYSRESRSAECENYQATDDPEYNFEVFWNTFEENYAFPHPQRGLGCHVQGLSARIAPNLSPKSLEIFGEMVVPPKDYHVSIRTREEIGHSGYKLRDKVDDVWELVRGNTYGNYNTRLNQLSWGSWMRRPAT